jgi:hypothetical protein
MTTLHKDNVTAASRRTLPTYPVFAFIVGLSFLLTPVERLVTNPALRYADTLIPIRFWGVAFIAVAAVLVVALCQHRRTLYVIALGGMLVWMALWSAVLLAAALWDSATWSAWVWPAVIARFCWASMVSLETQET